MPFPTGFRSSGLRPSGFITRRNSFGTTMPPVTQIKPPSRGMVEIPETNVPPALPPRPPPENMPLAPRLPVPEYAWHETRPGTPVDVSNIFDRRGYIEPPKNGGTVPTTTTTVPPTTGPWTKFGYTQPQWERMIGTGYGKDPGLNTADLSTWIPGATGIYDAQGNYVGQESNPYYKGNAINPDYVPGKKSEVVWPKSYGNLPTTTTVPPYTWTQPYAVGSNVNVPSYQDPSETVKRLLENFIGEQNRGQWLPTGSTEWNQLLNKTMSGYTQSNDIQQLAEQSAYNRVAQPFNITTNPNDIRQLAEQTGYNRVAQPFNITTNPNDLRQLAEQSTYNRVTQPFDYTPEQLQNFFVNPMERNFDISAKQAMDAFLEKQNASGMLGSTVSQDYGQRLLRSLEQERQDAYAQLAGQLIPFKEQANQARLADLRQQQQMRETSALNQEQVNQARLATLMGQQQMRETSALQEEQVNQARLAQLMQQQQARQEALQQQRGFMGELTGTMATQEQLKQGKTRNLFDYLTNIANTQQSNYTTGLQGTQIKMQLDNLNAQIAQMNQQAEMARQSGWREDAGLQLAIDQAEQNRVRLQAELDMATQNQGFTQKMQVINSLMANWQQVYGQYMDDTERRIKAQEYYESLVAQFGGLK